MEGVGSRQSRASSRYAAGPSPPPPLFTGRVRKWKKQWVTSSPAPAITKPPKRPLLLRRWTPLSAAAAAADDTPNRRFRYTPIVPIEKGKMRSVGDEAAMPVSKEESAPQEVNEDQAETDPNKTQEPVEM